MKKFNQKDYINVSVLIILFLLILFSIVGFKYVNGSIVDWDQQHWIIPEYFRNLFYETNDLFPSFAFNLGGGENIYNLSYYGLLSPFTLISYLLPRVTMINYIEVMMIIVVIASIILMYFWLFRRFDSKYAFIGTLLFLLAAPIIYHTHRHIMFINYMPFLLMALIGVDNYFEKNKKTLLIISIFLIIMTSYYYSVGALLAIVIYGIYKYVEQNEKITLKNFLKDGSKFIFFVLVGVLMSSILIMPTFKALLNGRNDVTQATNIFKYLIPSLNLDQLLYNSYTIGVTAILFFAIVYGLLNNKKQNKFLSIIFILITIFPIITYVLSGFMYMRGKVLIPMLPLAILLINVSLDGITQRKHTKFSIIFLVVTIIEIIFYFYQKQYVLIIDVMILFTTYILYKKYGNKKILIYPLCTCALVCCLTNNYTEKLVTKEDVSKQFETKNYMKLSDLLEKENNIYRVGNELLGMRDANRVVDTNYYLPSIYSSLVNQNYYKFTNNAIGSEMQERISTAILPTKNILFNTYMGMKYIISDTGVSIGYNNIENTDIYVNENVLPIGYSTSNVMSKDDYDELSYPDNVYAIFSNIVINKKVERDFESKVEKENLSYEINEKTIKIEQEDDKYIINSEENGKLKLGLEKTYSNKLLFISFDMEYAESCKIGDTSITINNVKNTLSCKGWTYPNKNNKFTYIISSNEEIDALDIIFAKGKYVISNIETYTLDYQDVLDVVERIDEFKINSNLTKGDMIVGDINVTENGYFLISIPYDEGFNIYLDENLIEYEKVDEAFIGFPINEGYHTIKIVYVAPYLLEGMISSIVGYMLFLPIIYSDIRRKKK